VSFVELEGYVEVLSGYAFSSKKFNEVENGMPIIRIRDVGQEESETYFDGEYDSKYLIKNGDLLIAMDGEFRLAKWSGRPSLLNQRVCKIKSVSDKLLDEYLYYVLPEKLKKIEDATSYVTVKHLSVKKINAIKIPLPSLSEQKAIVAKLEHAERLIDIDLEMMAKYDNLIQSVFLEMFGDPVRNEKGWERKPMNEIGEMKSGGTPSRKNKEYFTGEIDWYTTGELESMYLGDAEEKITETAIDESSAKLFEKGSLLIGMYDTSAFKLGILTGPGSSNQASANIKLDDEICNVEWLYYCLKIMRPSILHERRGIRQKNLTLGFLKKLEIIMPPLEKQIQFSKFLNKISDEKKATEVSTKKSEELFSSLVQGAFS